MRCPAHRPLISPSPASKHLHNQPPNFPKTFPDNAKSLHTPTITVVRCRAIRGPIQKILSIFVPLCLGGKQTTPVATPHPYAKCQTLLTSRCLHKFLSCVAKKMERTRIDGGPRLWHYIDVFR